MLSRSFLLLIAIAVTAPVVGQVNDLKRDVENAARQFRIQTYEKYRTNRSIYDQRIRAADQALMRFRQAADDNGRLEIQYWFAHVEESQDGPLPAVPEIQMLDSRHHWAKSESSTSAKLAVGANRDAPKTRNGFVVTDYESNPRFKMHRRNDAVEMEQRSTLVDSGNASIAKMLGESSQLLGGLKRSIFGGERNGEAEVPATNAVATNVVTQEANGDGWANEDASLDSFDSQIISQNLAVELLEEDFQNEPTKSIEFVNDCIARLEKLDSTFVQMSLQKEQLSAEEAEKLPAFKSLATLANAMLAEVNSLGTQLEEGSLADSDGTLEVALGSMRTRVSEVLASQTP